MGNVIELKQGATKEQIEQNQEAILQNAARYATIRKMALMPEKDRLPIEEAMRSIKEPTPTAQSFDKAIDIARALLNTPKPPEVA
jgi:hypothetical protein